ncbi:hypothetical protein [Amycolatopsis australiensis]|uniref:Uncharacterized protein n=1 Tax=Amycolatopsis australiensis TaxID=546364 RepID=A0A1K1LQU4_9PSEU|nr:hypothetical protein [Amycolatopsis australiensis]SFW13285.1 hypothetical protein SAMN04489730_0151 [Amycolatopsis australiensis]
MTTPEHPEITAMRPAYLALAGLDETRRRRAVRWLLSRLADDETAERAAAELSRAR